VSRRSLIERIDGLPTREYSGVLFRNVAPGYPGLSGEGARRIGGRWNPRNSFPVLYTATDIGTAALEVLRTAAKLGISEQDLLPRNLVTIVVSLNRILDLTDAAVRQEAGISTAVLKDDDTRICQAIGDAAHYLGFEGVLANSAAGPGETLAIFLNRLRARSRLDVARVEIIEKGDIT
jgi:RES domain-containing protein